MTEQELEELEDELKELKEKISESRKKGKDALIAWLKVINIPSKIKMAEATNSEKDIIAVRKLIKEAWKELPKEEISKERFKNVSEIFKQTKSYLDQAKKLLREGEKAEAKYLYGEIRKRFPALTLGQKKAIIEDCRQLINKLR
jgi:folate-binding Fe-S cluster repair protein YgfZ